MLIPPPLLRTPPELLLHIAQSLEIKDVICLRMTCRYLAAFSNERVVWALLRRKQCSEYRIPFSSYLISNMSATQLERAAVNPYRFVQKLLSPDPGSLRERVIDFSPSTTNGTLDTSNLEILKILPGGRFVLAHAGQMFILYDMGHPFSPSDGPRPKILASKAVACEIVDLCSISLDNSTHLVCIEAWSEANGACSVTSNSENSQEFWREFPRITSNSCQNSWEIPEFRVTEQALRLSTIYAFQFSFDDKSQTVDFQDYPHFETPFHLDAWTLHNSGKYILLLGGDSVIKHDFNAGCQVVHKLAEDLTQYNPHEMWLIASDTILALAISHDEKSQITICHLPSTFSSTTASLRLSPAMSISVDTIYAIATTVDILPASFLSLGYSVHDPDGVMFMCSGTEVSLTYRMIDYSPHLPNAPRVKLPLPIASHIPVTIDADDGVSYDCLIDRCIVGVQCLRDESGSLYIKGSVEHLRPTDADSSTLETPLHVQIARVHGDRDAKSIQIDAWRGCV